MGQQFANFAATTLNGGISAAATSLNVTSSAQFPVIGTSGVGAYFYAVISDLTEDTWEVIWVNAISGNTWTVVRGVDGTTALAWNTGSNVQLRPVAQALRDIQNKTFTASAFDNMTASQIADVQASTLIHDTTAALQSTVNNLGASGGGIMLFPPGNYNVSGTLQINYSNVILDLGGSTLTQPTVGGTGLGYTISFN